MFCHGKNCKCENSPTKSIVFKFCEYNDAHKIAYQRAEVKTYCQECYDHLDEILLERPIVSASSDHLTLHDKWCPSNAYQEITVYYCTLTDL